MKNHSSESYRRLLAWFEPYQSAFVAFSAGVDSTLILKAATDALSPENVSAITADSPSLPRAELEQARKLTSALKVEHIVVPTCEIENPDYVKNDRLRCYHCKNSFYSAARQVIKSKSRAGKTASNLQVLVDGTNHDDLGDYRPGLKAADEADVKHPLIDLKYGKGLVRDISRWLELPTWKKPEMACLASRIARGTEVSSPILRMVEEAESALQNIGFENFRVRLHQLKLPDAEENQQSSYLARIELHKKDITNAAAADRREQILSALKALGFDFVTIDLAGYQRGGGWNES